MTRYSVVIAAYNERARLLDAIDSVRNQTIPAEIIVVDDGSTTNVADLVRASRPDVRVISQPNRGKGIARNNGAFAATGEWLCFLDHDDLWHPKKLEVIDSYLQSHAGVLAVDHPVWIFREPNDPGSTAWGLKVDMHARDLREVLAEAEKLQRPANDFGYLNRVGTTYDTSLKRVFSTTSAIAVRRDAFFIAGGFNPGLANGEDWFLSMNIARLGEWHTIPQALSFQRALPVSDTSDPASLVMLLAALVTQWFGGRPLRERTRGFDFVARLTQYGSEYRQLARQAIWRAAHRKKPAEIRTAFHLSMALLPRRRDRIYVLTPAPLTRKLSRIRRRLRPSR